MFKIEDKYRTVDTEWASIHDNFLVFHFDEFPILYSGTNELGNKIIGSLCCEDDEGEVFRHFHSIVNNKLYNDFIKRKITYRDLLTSQKAVYILDKDISGNILESSLIPSGHIPIDYLPLEGVYCPNVEQQIGFDYSVSLQGKIADVHEAFSTTVAAIGKSTDKILNRLGDALKIKSLNPQVHQLPSKAGSFKLNFRVKISNLNDYMFYDEYVLKRYFQLCLDYSINTLSNEAEKLTQGEYEGTTFEQKLLPTVKKVYESFAYKVEDKYIQDFTAVIIETISDIEDIGSQVGNGFNGIEVSGLDSENREVSIGYIDKQYAEEISSVSQHIANIPRKGEIVDDDYQDYRILVYDLNTDTRKGTAHISSPNDADVMDNPKIKIEGAEELANSVLTESLHFNRWISVKAKAKIMNGKFKHLSILFE